MDKKILITGSQGMLATDLAGVANAAGYQVIGRSHQQLDVTQVDQVRKVLQEVKPEIVVNTPGIGVDACELDPDEGYRIHTWAARMLGQQCERIGSVFVYISTCGLFGDEKRFYSEYDAVHLKTNYAQSKYLGETAAKESCMRTFVIRPGWLFGGTPAHQRNFVYQRFLEAKKEPSLRSASDKFGCPTFTEDLSETILAIAETEQYGTYHVTNAGGASRYDYVKLIVQAFGMDIPVNSVDSSLFPRAANVPDCEMLDNLNLKFLGLPMLRPWQEAVCSYVESLKGHGW